MGDLLISGSVVLQKVSEVWLMSLHDIADNGNLVDVALHANHTVQCFLSVAIFGLRMISLSFILCLLFTSALRFDHPHDLFVRVRHLSGWIVRRLLGFHQ